MYRDRNHWGIVRFIAYISLNDSNYIVKKRSILIIQPSASNRIDWPRSAILGVVIALIITFINLFLKPFKTAESSQLLVLGYSVCFLVSYFIAYGMEYFLLKKLEPFWANRTLAFFILLFLLTTLTTYIYDLVIIKKMYVTWDDFIPYMFRVMLPFGCLVLPLIYLGRTAQITISQDQPVSGSNEVLLKGASSGEVLHTTSEKILYAKAENNYCDIVYLDATGTVSHQLFRIKISTLVSEIDCLTRCHRGFAINLDNVAHIERTKSKASVQLKWINVTLPVSQSYLESFSQIQT